MCDYSKCQMYKLRHKDDLLDENIYVGHTTDFNKRKISHKKGCCNPNSEEYNNKKNTTIRANGGWDEWEMLLIEDYPCANEVEALTREQELMDLMDAKLNTNRAIRTEEQQKEYHQNWRDTHKEERVIYDKKYRDTHKEELNEYFKNYNKEHKEEKKEYDKEYWEKIKEKRLQEVICVCGVKMCKSSLSKHLKSEGHFNKLNNIIPEKLLCECGVYIGKLGMAEHRKSKKHLETMIEINK
jgi:hypothetical protein